MNAEKLFLILFEQSLTAGWLVLAIIILRPFLRRASRSLCCALWGLVAFRLICPFSFESVFSLLPRVPETLPSGQTPIFPAVGQPNELFEPSAPTVDSGSQVLLQILPWIWLVGFSLLMLYALISTLRLHSLVRYSVKQEDGYWLCDWVGVSFVFGVFRPRIIMPFNVDRRDIPYILAHERAHLARRDHWRKPIAFLLLAVFWFQPLLWVAYYLFRRDVEFACDERAIRMLGADKECKASYAKALLESSSRHPDIAKLSGPLAFGGLQVKRRVSSVLTYRKPAAARIAAALLLCAVVAVCFLTDPKAEASAFVDTTSSMPAAEELIRPSAGKPIKSVEEPWYISDLFQFLIEKEGHTPDFALGWIEKRTKLLYERHGIKQYVIIDIDVDYYFKTGIMVKEQTPYVYSFFKKK